MVLSTTTRELESFDHAAVEAGIRSLTIPRRYVRAVAMALDLVGRRYVARVVAS